MVIPNGRIYSLHSWKMLFFVSSSTVFLSKLKLLEISFKEYIRVSNNLDPDQARHFVGPGLGPNYLQQ